MENKFLFQLWMERPTAAYLELSKEARQELGMKVFQAMEDTGGKNLMICDSRWATDRWSYFGVNRFPNLTQLQDYSNRLSQIGWLRYMHIQSYLGTETLPINYDIPPAHDGEEMIFKMFLVRFKEAYYAITPDMRNKLHQELEKCLVTAKGRSLVVCNMRWSNEQWLAFGIELFPNLDCQQEHTRMLEEMDWYRYTNSEVLLGVRQQGEM